MINVELVKQRLNELNLKQSDVANALDVAQPTANQKLNRIRHLSLDEAEKLATLLQISPDEFGKYFFAS